MKSILTREASMHQLSPKELAQQLLGYVDIHVNGTRPWDIQVHREEFYSRVFNEGALGLGESYMDKWWDCERLDIFFDKILAANYDLKIKIPFKYYMKKLLSYVINFQSKSRAKEVAVKHYDLGNDLFKSMLDSRMIYSCGYWGDAQTLEQSQLAKMELICKKLQIQPGMRVLDIGCGWGGLAKFIAQQYNTEVVGVTLSTQQYEYAKDYCHGLPVEIRLQDYRDLKDKFDRIVSVGMFEHVGHPNYPTFMQIVSRNLINDGLFLLHTIGLNATYSFANPWILKYIFPNGMLPSITQIAKTSENIFIMEDWHNFGADYDLTLMAWDKNFKNNWQNLKSTYDERFYRMWTYYLLSCAGSFRARNIQLWQILFSKSGIKGVYRAPR